MGSEVSVILTCNTCGCDYEVITSRASKSRYCSIECRDIAAKGELNATCTVCGVKFHAKPYRIIRSKNLYCSRDCHASHKTEYMQGIGNHQYGLKGETNRSFKKDFKINPYGYFMIRDSSHPFRNIDDFIMFHRLVLEEFLRDTTPASEYLIPVNGREQLFLDPEVVVHHKNGNKLDNRISNLEVLSKGDHVALHNESRRYVRDSLGRYVNKVPGVREDCPYKPFKGDIEDAGNDLRSTVQITLMPGESKLVSTQLTVAIPQGHVGFVWSRSGLAIKNNIECGAGCIDAGYRGEIIVLLRNFGDQPFTVNIGDRIAQLVILPISLTPFEDLATLSDTKRAEKGFGSTGIQ